MAADSTSAPGITVRRMALVLVLDLVGLYAPCFTCLAGWVFIDLETFLVTPVALLLSGFGKPYADVGLGAGLVAVGAVLTVSAYLHLRYYAKLKFILPVILFGYSAAQFFVYFVIFIQGEI